LYDDAGDKKGTSFHDYIGNVGGVQDPSGNPYGILEYDSVMKERLLPVGMSLL